MDENQYGGITLCKSRESMKERLFGNSLRSTSLTFECVDEEGTKGQ